MGNAAILPAIAPKLAKLIPLLASNHDGEVVNTARAIERTLKTAGLDLHALAAALVTQPKPQPAPEPEPRPKPATPAYESPRYTTAPARWRSLDQGEKVMAFDAILYLDTLTDWERKFARELRVRLRARPYSYLSEKQLAVLDNLLVKVWEREIQEWEARQ